MTVGVPSTDGEVPDAYRTLGMTELHRRADEMRVLLEQDGVTYNQPDRPRRHQPWVLDPLPFVIDGHEWRAIERATAQRAQLADLLWRDLTSEQRLLRRGIVPPEMVFADPQFLRSCAGITIPGPRQIVLTALDLVRDSAGSWWALGHRTQAPSGASYAMEDRRVVSRVFPRIFRSQQVAGLSPYVRALRQALVAAAPPSDDEPTVVVLTPGRLAETAFEHASVAAQLGYRLVQGTELETRHGRVWLRTIDDPIPVHVILRRLDGPFCDPLELRPDSTLGVPGLVDACRTGGVSVVNPLGSAVLENAGVLTVLDQLAPALLGEDLIVPQAPAWWCGDPGQRSHVVANLDSLVLRPLSRTARHGSVDGARLTSPQREQLRRRIEAQPSWWVGQTRIEPVQLDTLVDRRIEGRSATLRTFAVATGSGHAVMTGGLTRVALRQGAETIAGRRGVIAKDTWVVGAAAPPDTGYWLTGHEAPAPALVALSSLAAEHLYWLGRHTERAESTVRLLRVVNRRRDEFQDNPSGPGPASLSALLETLTRVTGTFPGFVGDDGADRRQHPDDELVSLVVDAARPGTVAHIIDRVVANTDVLRDQLPVDTWLVLGSLERQIDRLRGAADPLDSSDEVIDALLSGLLAWSGLLAESMVRDRAWHFLQAGRLTERAIGIVTLVAAGLGAERGVAAQSLLLDSVLTASDSIITYRRRYRSRARIATALELLLRDDENPRSLGWSVDHLRRSLAAVSDADVAGVLPLVDEVAALVEDADTTRLATPDDVGRREELEQLAGSVRTRLEGVADGLTTTTFAPRQPQHSVVTPAEIPTPAATTLDTDRP